MATATRKKSAAKKTPAKKAAVKKAPVKKSAAKKAPAKKAAPAAVKKAPAKKAAAEAAAQKPAPAKKENKMSKELELGSLVLVQVDPRQNGGSDVAVGVVVKAGEETVNVRAMLDSDENLYLRDVAVAKRAPKDEDKEQGEDETASEAKVRQRVCWPA